MGQACSKNNSSLAAPAEPVVMVLIYKKAKPFGDDEDKFFERKGSQFYCGKPECKEKGPMRKMELSDYKEIEHYWGEYRCDICRCNNGYTGSSGTIRCSDCYMDICIKCALDESTYIDED